ncbi:conserved exported hypothetical protein [Candidatus Sulfobium mesophilum]|uniref:Periplasmic heavy metal sensor n=1 Tax=Candidatus Sulfobium mesophilum TaxID=2016548 RepID=A0A2U3QKB8_9BACT|nr:conserved exported hypothetical protein [Candidatus Sulfobium mesophilum]
MKKWLMISIVVAVVALTVTGARAFGPGNGMGRGACYGTCPMAGITTTSEQSQNFAKFQSSILPLKQSMLRLKTELVTLRLQTPTDWAAVSAKQKEIIDVRTEIQKKAAESGFVGSGCGMRCNGQGRMGRMGL